MSTRPPCTDSRSDPWSIVNRYPVVYFITVTPFSITEWRDRDRGISYEVAALTSCIFTLSGFLNVILYFKTRPGLFKGKEGIQPTLREVNPLPQTDDQLLRSGGGQQHALAPTLFSTRRGVVEKEEAEDLYLNPRDRWRSPVEYLDIPRTRRETPHVHNTMEGNSDNGDEDVGQLPP